MTMIIINQALIIIKQAFFLLAAYLLGSIPFGILISRRYSIDIRCVGSKNTGATNVLRTVGKKAAAATLLGDLSKGMIAALLGKLFLSSSPELAAVTGLLAIVGHDWPVFTRFQGGKGVATSLGVFLILTPYPILLAMLVWFAVLMASRYVSLASISAAVALPLFVLLFLGVRLFFYTALVASVLLILKHRSNIQRLLTGTENRMAKRIKVH